MEFYPKNIRTFGIENGKIKKKHGLGSYAGKIFFMSRTS